MPKLFATPIDFYENTLGLVTINSGIRIPRGAAKDIKNNDLFPVGGFSTRLGYSRLNPIAFNSGAIMTGLYDASFSSGTHVLIGTGGNKIQKMDALDGTWDDLTGGLTLTAGQNNLWSFAMLNDICVLANGVDNCIQVSSALAASSIGTGSFSTALFVVEYRGYIFYGNLIESAVAFPDRLRFSNNVAPGTFTSTDVINVQTKQGGTLRGGIVYKDRLLCFKENGIYEIIFSPTRVASDGTLFPFLQNPNPVVTGVGSQSHRTLVRFTAPSTHASPGEYIFFVDQYGMPRIYSNGSGSFQVGYTISMSRDATIESLANTVRTTSVLRSQFAVNYPERNQIWLFSSISSQMDRCWVLDYTSGWAWTKKVFAEAFTCAALAQYTDGTYRVFTGDRSGFTDRQDTTTLDNTTLIDSYYRTADVFNESPAVKWNWPFLEIKGQTESDTEAVAVSYSKDGEDVLGLSQEVVLRKSQSKWGAGTIWGQFVWAKTGLTNRTLTPNLDAKTLGIKFQNVDGSRVIIEGFSLIPKEQGLSYE